MLLEGRKTKFLNLFVHMGIGYFDLGKTKSIIGNQTFANIKQFYFKCHAENSILFSLTFIFVFLDYLKIQSLIPPT